MGMSQVYRCGDNGEHGGHSIAGRAFVETMWDGWGVECIADGFVIVGAGQTAEALASTSRIQ